MTENRIPRTVGRVALLAIFLAATPAAEADNARLTSYQETIRSAAITIGACGSSSNCTLNHVTKMSSYADRWVALAVTKANAGTCAPGPVKVARAAATSYRRATLNFLPVIGFPNKDQSGQKTSAWVYRYKVMFARMTTANATCT